MRMLYPGVIESLTKSLNAARQQLAKEKEKAKRLDASRRRLLDKAKAEKASK